MVGGGGNCLDSKDQLPQNVRRQHIYKSDGQQNGGFNRSQEWKTLLRCLPDSQCLHFFLVNRTLNVLCIKVVKQCKIPPNLRY